MAQYNHFLGPTVGNAEDQVPWQARDLYQPTEDYLSNIFELAPSTEDFNPEDTSIPSSKSPIGVPSAQNTAQRGQASSNALMDAHKAVLDLSQGQYAGFEKDIRGNVIGATGREYRDPESGKVLAKTADWKADIGGLGRPYTPGLDAFKNAQIQSQKASAAAASTPEAIKSEQNRKQFLESQYGAGNIPASSLTATQQTRAASGASPFAEALKKKPETNPTV